MDERYKGANTLGLYSKLKERSPHTENKGPLKQSGSSCVRFSGDSCVCVRVCSGVSVCETSAWLWSS